MKVAGRIAAVLLALLVGVALVMFLWLLYPISAGVALFFLLRAGWAEPKGTVAKFVRRYSTPILFCTSLDLWPGSFTNPGLAR